MRAVATPSFSQLQHPVCLHQRWWCALPLHHWLCLQQASVARHSCRFCYCEVAALTCAASSLQFLFPICKANSAGIVASMLWTGPSWSKLQQLEFSAGVNMDDQKIQMCVFWAQRLLYFEKCQAWRRQTIAPCFSSCTDSALMPCWYSLLTLPVSHVKKHSTLPLW